MRGWLVLGLLNGGLVAIAWLFRQTVAPGWKKGPLIDPASPYSPENAMVLFAVAACLFVDTYVLLLALARRRGWKRAWVAWAAMLVGGVVAEGGVRAWLAVDMVTYFRPHPTLHWVVRPNLRDFDNLKGGGRITTNADGLREVTVPRAKAPGEVRVLVLGDSSNFGHGVEGDEMWSSVLGRLVPTVTVINGATPGWTTFQAVELLRTTGAAYQPDLVIAGFNNDPGPEYLPDHARVPGPAVRAANAVLFRLESYLLGREVFLSLLRRAAGGYTARDAGAEPLYGKLSADEAKGLVPRVSKEEFLANLVALDELAPDFAWINMPINRTEPELVERYVDPSYRVAAADLAKARGFRLVDVDDRWSRTREADLFSTGHVFHPNAAGHARLAQQVAVELFGAQTPIEGPPAAATEATLRLGISSLTPVHAHVAAVLAAMPGLAAKHGLDLALTTYASGKTQGDDLAHGALDAYFSCEIPAVRMLKDRPDTRVVAGPGVLGRIAVVAPTAPTLTALAKGRVGVTKGSTPAMDWAWWGRELGATEVDVKTEDQLGALERGEVDAVAAWDPWVADWLARHPDWHVVAERQFRSVLAVSVPWSTREPGRAERLVALVEEALRIAGADRPRWDAEVAALSGWPLPVVKAVADQNDLLAGRPATLDVLPVDREILDRAARWAGGPTAQDAVAIELREGKRPTSTRSPTPSPSAAPGGPATR